MAVFTFSTQDVRRPEDKEVVDRVKAHCEQKDINFSRIVVALIRKWEEDNA